MPAPRKPTPSIYLNGSVLDTEGVFRSEDEGRTWVRIDDGGHEFGWKNSVIGDPRIYSRVYLATGGRGIVYGDPRTSDRATETRSTSFAHDSAVPAEIKK